jgi:hypothetical protein
MAVPFGFPVPDLMPGARNAVEVCLAVQPTERVALIADSGASVLQWTVDDDAELVLDRDRACHLDAGQTLTAVCRGSGPMDIERSFRMVAAGVTRAVTGGVVLETQDGTGAALAWAKARLWLHHRAATDAPALAALASPAIGCPDQLRLRLDHTPDELLPLLAARFAAWTGRLEDVRPALARAKLALGSTAGNVATDDYTTRVLRLAGIVELERTAADLALPQFAADLRALARGQWAEQMRQPLHPRAGAMLAALIARPDDERPREPAWWTETDDVAYHAWLTWAALARGLAAGGPAWHRLVGETDSAVRGAWPAHFGVAGDDPAATALVVLTLVHGVLGLEPDAARHRIRIAPRLSPLGEFAAVGIPCGDTQLSVRVRHEERGFTIGIAQESGAIPLTAVLEPWLVGRLANTWVDGRRADLDARPHGDGMLVGVQLVLDEERTLTLEREAR